MSRRRRHGQTQAKTERELVHYVDSPCKKRAYLTRVDARKVEKKHDRSRGLRPFLCGSCGLWHLGHLPKAIVQGKRDKIEFYA